MAPQSFNQQVDQQLGFLGSARWCCHMSSWPSSCFHGDTRCSISLTFCHFWTSPKLCGNIPDLFSICQNGEIYLPFAKLCTPIKGTHSVWVKKPRACVGEIDPSVRLNLEHRNYSCTKCVTDLDYEASCYFLVNFDHF